MRFLYSTILLILLFVNLIKYATAHTCAPCLVRACYEILGEHFYVELPAHSSGAIDSSISSCAQLNVAIQIWNRKHVPDGTCSAIPLAELACEQLVVMNQTQIGCDSTSIAMDPSFRSQCEQLIQCNIPSPERITRSNACQASNNFVDALHFDMGPISSSGCTSCRLHACDGWSTPSTMSSTSPTGKLELGKVELYLSSSDIASGVTCDALQHAIHALATSPVDTNSPHDHVVAMNATCFPLAKASNYEWGSERCGLSAQLYDELDPVVFNQLSMSRGALSWPHVCPKYLHSVYAKVIAEQLISTGYCNSPTTGLLKFVANYVNASVSSTGPSGSGDSNHADQRRPVVSIAFLFVLVVVALL